MAAETAEDRAALFDPEEHGVEVRWAPQIGAPSIVAGIFDGEYISVEIAAEGDVGVDSVTPMLWIADEAMPGVAEGDSLRISDLNYIVRSVQPDGTGTTALQLERV